ncbi:hypothetical protein ACFLXN_01425 [Chloroflexota bacterium]
MIFSVVFLPFKLLPKLVRYLLRRLKGSFVRSRQIHRISLKRKEGWLRLAIAVALAGLIAWQLLRTEFKTGITFCLSSSLAIYSGLIYKSRAAIVLVLVGAMLGVLAFSLVPYLQKSVGSGDYIGVGVVLVVMLSIWLWSSRLKKADIPDDWKEPEVPQKTTNKTPNKAPVRTLGKTPVKTTKKITKKTPGKATKSREKRL